jgi:hypothetical protein
MRSYRLTKVDYLPVNIDRFVAYRLVLMTLPKMASWPELMDRI